MSTLLYGISVDNNNKTNHKNYERKARKELAAIAKLKKRGGLTPEENIQVDNQDYWYQILDPCYINLTPKIQNKEREREREREREKEKDDELQEQNCRRDDKNTRKFEEHRRKFEERCRKFEERCRKFEERRRKFEEQ